MRSWRTFLVILVLLLSVVHTIVFVKSIQISEEINALEIKTKAIHQKNIDLEAEVYKRGSFDEVASQAAKLGFVKSSNTHNLKLGSVARRE